MFNIEEEVYGLVENFAKIITTQGDSRDEEKKKQEERKRKYKEHEEYLKKKEEEDRERKRRHELRVQSLFNGIEEGDTLTVSEILENNPEYLEIAAKQINNEQKLTPIQFAIHLYTGENQNMLELFSSLVSSSHFKYEKLQAELDEWDNICQFKKMDANLLRLKIALIKQVNKHSILYISNRIIEQYTLYQAMAELDKDTVENILKQQPELSLKKLFKNFKIVDLNANEFIPTQTPLQFAIKTNQTDMIQLIFTYLDMENINVKKEVLNQWLEEEKTCSNTKEIKSLKAMLLYEITQEESYSIETQLPKYYSTSLTNSLFYKVLPTVPHFEFNNGDSTNTQKDYYVTEMDEKTFICN